MARRKAPKRIRLQRAAYMAGAMTLEVYLDRAIAATPRLQDREIAHPVHGTLRINQYRRDANGALLQLVAKQPGELASTVGEAPNLRTDAEVPVAAPTGRSFKSADLFALIRGNNILICTDGIRHQVLEHYLKAFFVKSAVSNRAVLFEIEKVGNAGAIDRIQRSGVKEIRLDGTLYAATMDRMRRQKASSKSALSLPNAYAWLTDHLSAVFEKDDGDDFAQKAENMQVRVVIRAEGGSRGEEVILNQLESAGIDLVEEAPEGVDYTIVTKDGVEIRSEEINLSRPVVLERLDAQNSLSFLDVWDKLVATADEFERSGDLER